jgi:hypothetical protein
MQSLLLYFQTLLGIHCCSATVISVRSSGVLLQSDGMKMFQKDQRVHRNQINFEEEMTRRFASARSSCAFHE